MKRVLLAAAVLVTGTLAAAAADPLDGYAPVAADRFGSPEGPTIMGLFRKLTEGHPESLEGRGAMKVEITKTPDGNGFLVDIEQTGFLDDSVRGERHRALVVPGNQWKIDRIGRQFMCYRGPNAGKWTTRLCP